MHSSLRSSFVWAACLVVTIGAHAPMVAAQAGVIVGVVRSRASHLPVVGARLLWNGDSLSHNTDGQGRFRIPMPDSGAANTLHVSAIGFRMTSIIITGKPDAFLTIDLTPVIVSLPNLVAINSDPLVRSGGSEWVVDGVATRVMPVAVEPDAFRVLRLVPAVSFSSFLSGRPLVRGLGADEASYSIDGYEAINLFHLGRMFSAFPSLGVGRLRVSTQPSDLTIGNTTGGQIAVEGLNWSTGQRPEIQYGLGAWSGRAGWRGAATSGVIVGRTVQGAATGIAAAQSSSLSLNLYDLYGRFDLGGDPRPLSLTFFRSVDRVNDSDPDEGAVGASPAVLDWDNLIIGATARAIARRHSQMTLRASYSEHSETATDIPGRGTSVDVDNQLSRLGITADARIDLSDHLALRFGAEGFRRTLRNSLVPADTSHIPRAATDVAGFELAGFGGIEAHRGALTWRAGLRIDHATGVTVAQPRVSLRAALGQHTWASIGAGRAARVLHLISDARTEPKLAYYDIWLPAGSEVPAAITDNLAGDTGWQDDVAAFRLGAYASRGRGQMEFVPPEIAVRNPLTLLRAGKLRSFGLEAEVTLGQAAGRLSGQFSYTLGWSDRQWGGGWVPWVNDRRHRFRATGVWRPSPQLFFSTGLEIASGIPYTPWLAIDSSGTSARAVYGAENSARGRPMARLDLAGEKSFAGTFGTEMALGLTVLNLAIGDQAPREPLPPRVYGGRIRVSSQPMFHGVPVPSLLLRIKF